MLVYGGESARPSIRASFRTTGAGLGRVHRIDERPVAVVHPDVVAVDHAELAHLLTQARPALDSQWELGRELEASAEAFLSCWACPISFKVR